MKTFHIIITFYNGKVYADYNLKAKDEQAATFDAYQEIDWLMPADGMNIEINEI